MYLYRLIYQYLQENYFDASLGTGYRYLNFRGTSVSLLIIIGGFCLGMMIASLAVLMEKRVAGQLIRRLLKEKAHTPETGKTLSELGLSKNALVKKELSGNSALRKLVAFTENGEVYTYQSELEKAFPSFYAECRRKEEAKTESVRKEETDTAVEKPTAAENGKTEAADISPCEEDKAEDDALANARYSVKRPFGGVSFKPRKQDFFSAKFFIPESLRIRAELRYEKKGNSFLTLAVSWIAFIGLFFLALRFIPAFVSMLDSSIGNFLGK
ncbi:MAG: hypothetical protein MJ078_03980 [Clostridia bacterium]|nr:hypothetical protein [Clostridia bacterium]